MKNQYVSFNAVCLITGYKKGYIFAKATGLNFPQPVRRNNTLMFRLDQILKWDKENRSKLITKWEAVKLLNVSWNEFDNLINDDRFPKPAFYSSRSVFWTLGDILNYRAKWRR